MPVEFTGDPLWRMEVYRLALFASDLAWQDVCNGWYWQGRHTLVEDVATHRIPAP